MLVVAGLEVISSFWIRPGKYLEMPGKKLEFDRTLSSFSSKMLLYVVVKKK